MSGHLVNIRWAVRKWLAPILALSLSVLLLPGLVSGPPAQSGGAGQGQDADAASAQEASADQGQVVYLEGVSLFPTRVRLPDDYDASKSYTLVVGLHGHGGRADDFFRPAPWFADVDVIYAVPQAPYAFPSLGRIGYSWNLRGFDDDAGDQGADALTESYILGVVDALAGRYSVDDVYLMGFSQGGAFTYLTGIKHHERFAGLIAYGSRFSPEWFSEGELAGANHLRVFISHGLSDPVAPVSTQAADTLRELGYEVGLFEFEGGHVISRPAIEALLRWLKR